MEKIDLLKKVKGTKGYFTPGYLKQEIQRRQKLYQEYSHCNDVEKAAQLHREYKVVKLEVSKKIYDYSQKRWHKSIENTMTEINKSHSARKGWIWVKRCLGRSGDGGDNNVITPIQNEQGQLLVDVEEIKARWA